MIHFSNILRLLLRKVTLYCLYLNNLFGFSGLHIDINIKIKHNLLQEVKKMPIEIIAHRGASQEAPENTLPAFQRAYELGVDGIETDIHLTKDLIPILIHDDNLKRTANHLGYVKDFTFTQLKNIDVGGWFAKEYLGTPILSLEDFLTWIKPKNLNLNIELKNNKIKYNHLEYIVYEILGHYQLLERTTISTFNKDSVKRMSKLNVEVAYLTSRHRWNPIKYGKMLGADAVHIKHTLLNSRLIKQSREEDIPVRVYTVNKVRQILKCFNHNCHGIFTDIPKTALELRGEL